VVGGSSAVNYCLALRSRPADHEAWAALRLPDWSWSEVLPYYRRLENDPNGDPRWHGRAGPVPVRRATPDELTAAQLAFLSACESEGQPAVTDHNSPDALGAGIAPLNQVDGIRQSAAHTHLAEALARPNLRLCPDTEVHSVLLEGTRAVGVRLASGAVLHAGQVVLCAGSYSSPAILMRSGIGPSAHLGEVGVKTVVDRPAVGADLVEHPAYRTVYAAIAGSHPVPRWRTMLSLKSSPELADVDLHIQARSITPTRTAGAHPTGYDLVMAVGLLQPRSRGSVRLRSADLADPPVIDLGLYRSPEDVLRIAYGVRLARRLANHAALRDLLAGELQPGVDVADADVEDAVLTGPAIYNHPVGTCRMGPPGDPSAVVDGSCRVHGTEDLLVIDAAVFPVSPRATTHLPTMMLAERAVALNWPARQP
jgi:choline dehydrogenase